MVLLQLEEIWGVLVGNYGLAELSWVEFRALEEREKREQANGGESNFGDGKED